MRFPYLCVGLLVVVVGLVSSSLSSGEKEAINKGLDSANALSKLVKDKKFSEAITKLAGSVETYLPVIGPIVGIFLGLIGTSESVELLHIKRLFTEIDSRFNRLDTQFADVKKHIDFSTTETKFGIIEQKIIAVSKEFQKVYNVPKSAMKSQLHLFVLNYDSDFQNSASKLYDGIMNPNGVFVKSLGEAARDFTDNDRRKVQGFMLGLLQLILQGAKLELAYLKAKGPRYQTNFEFAEKDWKSKISRVRSKMLAIDNDMVHTYTTQVDKDVKDYAAKYYKVSNQNIVGPLYTMLKNKYYWRDWMVLAYKPLAQNDNKNHHVHACGGAVRYQTSGRDIVAASADPHHHFDVNAANAALAKIVVVTKRNPTCHMRCVHHTKTAQEVFNVLPSSARSQCSAYSAAAVVGWGQDVWVHYRTGRLALRKMERYYTAFLFG